MFICIVVFLNFDGYEIYKIITCRNIRGIWWATYNILIWHLQDFYLDLIEDNKRITPRDYLEIALRPMQGAAKDVAGKNEVVRP